MLSIEKLENLNKYKNSMKLSDKHQLKVEGSNDLIEKHVAINMLRKQVNNKPKEPLEMVDKETQTDSD
jgi:hypothetical protein